MKYLLITLGLLFAGILVYAAYAYFFRYDAVQLPEKSLIEKVYVERLADGSYLIEFTEEGEYQIFQGKSLETINWTQPIMSTRDPMVKLSNYDFSDRYFFGIKNGQGTKMVVSERRIPMEGADNFRDLGGIPTSDGRVVKWGTFYRSGKLTDLSPKDLNYYKTLGITTVVDFRDDKEVAKNPSRFPAQYTVNKVRVPIGDRDGRLHDQIKEQIRKANAKTFDSKKYVENLNRQFIDSFAYQYAPFIELAVAAENTPLLFHCSAGKDRTGLATALLLSVLGVEKEVILGDFMMSNYYRNARINRSLKKSALAGISQRITQPLVEVDETYLAAALQAIDDKYGSMESFLEEEFGLTEARLQTIRDRYLYSNDENVKIVSTEEAEETLEQ